MNSIEQLIVKMYQNGVSTYEICEQINQEHKLNYYPNKVNRLLRKIGCPIRSKNESQKIALDKGRATHPTKGRLRSDQEKIAIGKTVKKKWAAASPERLEKHSKTAKKNWDKMTPEELKDFRSKSAKAIRKTCDTGSKLERYIIRELRRADWKVQFHTNHLLPTGKLEMDIFVEDVKAVVEIDGVTHYEPIHGEEQLARVTRNDNLKNAMAVQNGYNMIRIRCTPNKVSLTYCLETYEKLDAVLQKLKENPFLPIEQRLIYI